MKNDRINIDDELLASYLAGEINANDRKIVEEWISRSDSNEQYFVKLKGLWEKTGRIAPDQEADVDVDLAWDKFKQKATGKSAYEPVVKPKVRTISFYLSRVAAIVIFGFVVYLVYQSLEKSPTANKVILSASENTISDTLPDGSQISLNEHSIITYDEDFLANERLIGLSGEAFFDVVKNDQKPFIIKTDGATVKVLGTSFYVRSYDSLSYIEVGVEKGTVQVISYGNELILKAGEYTSVNKHQQEFTEVQTYDPNEVFWMSGTITFDKTPLSNVFSTLEKAYNVSIDVEHPDIMNCRLTGKFYREPVERVFDIIDANFGFTTIREEEHFKVSGQGCD